jgi:hypothetical protein
MTTLGIGSLGPRSSPSLALDAKCKNIIVVNMIIRLEPRH